MYWLLIGVRVVFWMRMADVNYRMRSLPQDRISISVLSSLCRRAAGMYRATRQVSFPGDRVFGV